MKISFLDSRYDLQTMLRVCYLGRYNHRPTMPGADAVLTNEVLRQFNPPLVRHLKDDIRAHTVAVDYRIPLLKHWAVKHARAILKHPLMRYLLSHQQVAGLIRQVYTSDHDFERGIRDLFLRFVFENRNILVPIVKGPADKSNEPMLVCMREVKQFGLDMHSLALLEYGPYSGPARDLRERSPPADRDTCT